MKENWKDIPGYEGSYQASDQGRIRGLDRPTAKGRVLKTPTGKRGYKRVNLLLSGEQKQFCVCQLVARTWIGTPEPNQEVRHGVGGKLDDSLSNLCYGTKSENLMDRRRDRTSGKPVRNSLGHEFDSASIASEKTGIHRTSIGQTCRGVTKTAGGLGWEFIQPFSSQIESATPQVIASSAVK